MRSLSLLLLLGLPLSARGQSSPSVTSEAPLSADHGAFFALSVPDLAASTRWYAEKLGLRVTMRVPRQGGVAVTVLEGVGLTVELLQLDAARPRDPASSSAREPQLTHGIFKVGFVVDDFDATIARLRARGVEIAYGPFPPREGQRANAIIRDNAGNLIQLFARK
jgi:catechol 2,3-dioxygenase-like lactoylglutathione lyase family enzyme